MKYFLNLSFLFFSLVALLPVSGAWAQCPTAADVLIASHTNVTCNGANDGTITVDIKDSALGTPYNFELYDLNAGAVVIGAPEVEDKTAKSVVYSSVKPGTYAVLLFKSGCGYPGGALTIIEPPFGFVVDEPAVLDFTSTIQPDCDPSAAGTGQIDITISGGNAPYTIVWTGPTAIANGTTSTAANLNAGTYHVDITDAKGCNTNGDIIVAVSTQADAGPATGLTCGTNSFTLSGNTPNASEKGTWTGPAGVTFSPDANTPNATANNLNVGVNTLTWTITDIAGICTGTSDNIDVTYSNIDLNGTADVALDCFGDTDGTGTFTISGGIAPFTWSTVSNTAGATYTLPPTGATTMVTFTNGGAGVVTLQVQDASGCTSQTTITITQPTALSASVGSTTSVACKGGATGAIDINVSGGTPGYTYVWSNGANTQDINGLIAGTYSVTVTDANGCTTTLNNISVTEPATVLSASVGSTTNVACNGGATGAIDINVSGGTPGYTYAWSNGANMQDINSLTAGTYSVTVTDANGCTTTLNNISVIEPATALSASVGSTTNVLCKGGATGVIDINVSGGTPGYTYVWSNGATTQDINGLTAGTYSVTVTDANGCTTTLNNISVTEPAVALSASVGSTTNVACNGSATGAIDINVSGGTPGYTYVWSNGANTQDINGLTAGTYSVTITDANGCTTTLNNISVTEPATALSASVGSTTNVACNGSATGAIDINVSGGTPGYTYVWSNGANTQDINGLTAGTYSVTVTDANGCTTTLNNISVTEPAVALSASVGSTTNVACKGGATGAIDINVSGGTPGYTYVWSNGANTQDINGLTAGTYSVTVTDANGCTTTVNNISVTEPATALSASVGSTTNVACKGGATGAIDIDVTGGTPGYTYVWSNGATTQDINSLTAGTYSVTVTDANGCTTTVNNISITEPATALSASVGSTTNVLCNGGATGAIDINVTGGTPGYTYVWSNGATTQDINSLTAGTYSVTVTDANGCTTTVNNISVTEPATALSASVGSTTNVACNGGATGAIDINVTGGTPGYTYVWSNGATTQDISSLTAGTYSVTVTDANGCTTTVNNISVTEPATALSASVGSTTNVLCKGGATGAIDIDVIGGTTGYTYVWSNGSTTQDVTGLVAGTYSVTVTDANGCTTTVNSISITEPATGLSASVGSTTNVLCNGDATGAIDIDVIGGTPGYTYVWSNGSTTQDVTGLVAGTYSVTVADANGCTTTVNNISITEPATALSASVGSTTNVACNGGATGAIDINVTGGTPGYTYVWSNGSTTQDISSLTAGTYSVTVTDANGCTTTVNNISITEPATALSASVGSTTNVACNGGATGAIDINVIGGTPGYTYVWSNGSTTQDVTGLVAGTYSVTVADANGCSVTLNNISITEPAALVISSTSKTDATCLGVNDGTIQVNSVTGGTPGYQYSSDGGTSFQLSNTFTNLAPGTYDVVARDSKGCISAIATVTINSGVTFSPTTSLTDATCSGINDGTIQVNSVSGGVAPYTYSKDGGVNFQASNTFNGLAPGNYDVLARDANGCISTTATVTIGSGLVFDPQATINDASCSGVNDGSIQVTGTTGGAAPFEYSINGGTSYQSSDTFNGLASGSYDVVVRDANGCVSTTLTATVGSGLSFDPTATPVDASCAGVSDGSLQVTGTTGGVAPFEYSNNGGTTFQPSDTFTGLAVGSYDIVVRDANGCISTTLSVAVGAGLSFDPQATATDASCSGVNDGTIQVTGTTGGVAPFEYSDNAGVSFQVSDTFTGLAVGSYDIVVRDANGCISTTLSVAVGSGISFDPQATPSNASCGGVNDGSIQVTGTTGGVAPFEYSNNGGTSFQPTDTFSGLAAGNYDIVVRDANGCVSTTLPVTVSSALTISIAVGKTDATCLGNDGSITVNTVTGGTGPYEYSINNGGTFQASNVFAPASVGNYNVVVRDANGCLSGATPITVNLPGGCGGTNCFAFILTVDPTLTRRPTCNNQNNGTIVLGVTGTVAGNYIIQLLKPTDPSFTALTQVGPSGTYTFNGLSPGNYEYKIQDQAGNVCQQPYSLPVESTVDADASAFVDATCFGQPTGQATLTVLSGGSAPFEYSLDGTTWVTFTSPHTITDLPPNGTYSILVRNDATDLCPDQVTVTINNTNPPISAGFTETAATCGNADGAIAVSTAPSGGSGGPYTFKIDGLDATAPFTNLIGGTHIVTVIDGSGCSQDFTRVVPYPNLIEVGGISTTDASCGAPGNISLFINNFLPAVQYEVGISNSLFDEPTAYFTQYYLGNGIVVISDLNKGDYFVWLRTGSGQCPTIANNIIANAPIVINGPFALSFDLGCRNTNGDLELRNVTGAPAVIFNYEVFGNGFSSTGTFTPDALGNATISGFSGGTYSVKISQNQTSVGGCPNEETAFVLAPLAPLDTVFVRIPTPTDKYEKSYPESGTASRVVRIQESGQLDYQIKLEQTQSFGQDDPNPVRGFYTVLNREQRFDDLYAGLYTMTLTDGYGCVRTYDLTIPLDDRIWIPNIFTPNDDGVNDTFQIRNLPVTGSTLIVSNRWGKEVFSATNYQGDWSGSGASDGVYYYRLQIEGGKVYTGWIEIARGQKP